MRGSAARAPIDPIVAFLEVCSVNGDWEQAVRCCVSAGLVSAAAESAQTAAPDDGLAALSLPRVTALTRCLATIGRWELALAVVASCAPLPLVVALGLTDVRMAAGALPFCSAASHALRASQRACNSSVGLELAASWLGPGVTAAVAAAEARPAPPQALQAQTPFARAPPAAMLRDAVLGLCAAPLGVATPTRDRQWAVGLAFCHASSGCFGHHSFFALQRFAAFHSDRQQLRAGAPSGNAQVRGAPVANHAPAAAADPLPQYTRTNLWLAALLHAATHEMAAGGGHEGGAWIAAMRLWYGGSPPTAEGGAVAEAAPIAESERDIVGFNTVLRCLTEAGKHQHVRWHMRALHRAAREPGALRANDVTHQIVARHACAAGRWGLAVCLLAASWDADGGGAQPTPLPLLSVHAAVPALRALQHAGRWREAAAWFAAGCASDEAGESRRLALECVATTTTTTKPTAAAADSGAPLHTNIKVASLVALTVARAAHRRGQPGAPYAGGSHFACRGWWAPALAVLGRVPATEPRRLAAAVVCCRLAGNWHAAIRVVAASAGAAVSGLSLSPEPCTREAWDAAVGQLAEGREVPRRAVDACRRLWPVSS